MPDIPIIFVFLNSVMVIFNSKKVTKFLADMHPHDISPYMYRLDNSYKYKYSDSYWHQLEPSALYWYQYGYQSVSLLVIAYWFTNITPLLAWHYSDRWRFTGYKKCERFSFWGGGVKLRTFMSHSFHFMINLLKHENKITRNLQLEITRQYCGNSLAVLNDQSVVSTLFWNI